MRPRGTNTGSRIQVVVAESTPIFSQLLADALKRDRSIDVVGSVSTSGDLLQTVYRLPVDVAVVSCNLEQPRSGFAALRELRVVRPTLRGIMLLESSKPEIVVEAFRAGAVGIFCKSEPVKSLCKCIRCVYEGQVWASCRELLCALDALATTPSINVVNAKGISLLSKRQLDVVRCVAAGLTNLETGQQLGLSKHTVKNYLLRIFEKVGVSNRVELLFLTLSEPLTTERRNSSAADNRAKAATSEDLVAPLQLPNFRREEVENRQDSIHPYVKCLLSETANREISNQMNTTKQLRAQSMTPDQILDAERKAATRAAEPTKPSLGAAPASRRNPIQAAKAKSA